MDHQEFKQARDFIFSDINREISLAKASENDEGSSLLRSLGVQTGGGNFLAAMGLLTYTEFFGSLKYNHTAHGSNSKNFNSLLDDLGNEYKSFRASGA